LQVGADLLFIITSILRKTKYYILQTNSLINNSRGADRYSMRRNCSANYVCCQFGRKYQDDSYKI